MKFLLQFLPTLLKNAGDGKYGPQVKKAYWLLHDYGLFISIGFGILQGVLTVLQAHGVCPSWLDCVAAGTWLTDLTVALGAGGILTNAQVADGPTKEVPKAE
jgi:hypothetical protein